MVSITRKFSCPSFVSQTTFFRGNIYEIVLSLVRLSIILSAKHVSHHLTSYLSKCNGGPLVRANQLHPGETC